jgi:hypothetical protein
MPYNHAATAYERMVEDVMARLGVDDDPGYYPLGDVARYGADTGWPGFTYTAECVGFFDAHEGAIMDALREDADAFGYATVAEFVASFHRADMADTMEGYKNLLTWYVLERVCLELANG